MAQKDPSGNILQRSNGAGESVDWEEGELFTLMMCCGNFLELR